MQKQRIYETLHEYIQDLINDGYIDEDGFLLKCMYCNKDDAFERCNEYYAEYGGIEEYEVWCKRCDQKVGHWAFGNWCFY